MLGLDTVTAEEFSAEFYKACREKYGAYVHWYGRLDLNCHLEKNSD